MRSYHGTSNSDAKNLLANDVDVSIGGGELGRGFYTGEYLHEAKAWAFHKSGDRQKNVVSFDTDDSHVLTLTLFIMNARAAALERFNIRKSNTTRLYLYGYDMVWAPIVGSAKASGDQYKWESNSSETLLNNNSKTSKRIY